MAARFVGLCLLPLLTGCRQEAPSGEHRGRPDVLLVCIDDLRPDLGAFGDTRARTPNLDALAGEARLFRRHYVAVPTCGASRRALLTGRLPRNAASLDNGACAALAAEGAEAPPTLPALLRAEGYETVCLGKVSHAPGGRLANGTPELRDAWSRVVDVDWPWGPATAAFFGYADGSTRVLGESPPHENADVGDEGYPDGHLAREAGRLLRAWAQRDDRAPFFLAVGFYKPHLPFTAPASYLRPFLEGDEPAPPLDHAPLGVDPGLGLHASGELLRNYGGPSREEVSPEQADVLRRAYRAATHYVDAQVGRVLTTLRETGLDATTLVVVWSDHGWHLGDQGLWGKHTLFERALHSPLLVRAPGMAAPGAPCDAIVEAVDVLPTVLAHCGVVPPAGLDGRALEPALADPNWSPAHVARSFWHKGERVGVSLRDDTARVTVWLRGEDLLAGEWYDHERDPYEGENRWSDLPDEARAGWEARARAVAAPLLRAADDVGAGAADGR